MKYLLLLLFCLSCSAPKQIIEPVKTESHMQLAKEMDQELNWFPFNEQTLLRAKTDNKLIIIQVEGKDDLSEVMKKITFTDADIVKHLNMNYIVVSFDINRHPEAFTKIPTTLFMTPDGYEFYRLEGLTMPDDFKRVLIAIINKLQ